MKRTNKNKRKIVVGGGGGYIGSALVPALLSLGHEVKVMDLFWFGNHMPEGVTVVKKDLFDCTVEDFSGYDTVIFLAGLSNDPMAEFDPSLNFKYNAALPSFLAYIAKKAGVKKYIYASSCSIYGFTDNRIFTEKSAPHCDYPYGISKLQGEHGIMQLQNDDFSVIALRQGTVSGVSPRMRMDLIVNTMFKSAMTTGTITVNNPVIWRPIFDIRDTVSAYLRAIEAGPRINGIFNVASVNHQTGEVADIVRATLERETGMKINIDEKSIPDFRNYRVSWKKAERELGFRPKHGIADTVRHLLEHRHKFSDFDRDEYHNIRVFRKLAFAKDWLTGVKNLFTAKSAPAKKQARSRARKVPVSRK